SSPLHSPSVSHHIPRRPPSSTLFPYTTLFRSDAGTASFIIGTRSSELALRQARLVQRLLQERGVESSLKTYKTVGDKRLDEPLRSEEHTSELQSHLNLVCRLLLEKKKKTENV